VYFADGSIRQTTFTNDDAAFERLSNESTQHDQHGRPIHRELAEIWPADKVSVRMLTSEEAEDQLREATREETAETSPFLRKLLESLSPKESAGNVD
jgi:hypothetical protein